MGSERVGRLVKVPLRNVWLDEARDFTPWLVDNIEVLADELDIGALTVKKREFAVGSYSLDILAETDEGRVVAIENQLEASDHRHLGQCLTYASGVGAWAVVWVVREFCEEHRSALDWLNQHTDDGVHFFGVQVQAVTIGDSAPAAVFKVIARPNDWERSVRLESTAGKTQSVEEFLSDVGATAGQDIAHAVEMITKHWVETLGGHITFGVRSLFLNLTRPDSRRPYIWPCGLLAKGYVQFAFQPLSIRAPFDQEHLREALRDRMNAIPGVTVVIPADGLTRYPSMRLGELTSSTALPKFIEALDWFAAEVAKNAMESPAP